MPKANLEKRVNEKFSWRKALSAAFSGAVLGVMIYYTYILPFSRNEREEVSTPYQTTPTITETIEPIQAASQDYLDIASFNIQIFGRSKIEENDVMSVLSNIACNFDVMAIQELRDKTETTLNDYVIMINQTCDNGVRNSIMGPRLGRTSSKENYAFIYNTSTVALMENPYTFEDNDDVFEREPYIARFRAIGGNFDFIIVNNHIKPDDALNEISYLPTVVLDAENYYNEYDVIVLGDMNADCDYLNESNLGVILTGLDALLLIPDSADTTTKATVCTYDRIFITNETVEDYAGEWEVFRFDQVYNLPDNLVTRVSDHFPVWARFYINMDTD